MRARWIRKETLKSYVGFAVVARWLPGQYYLVSTTASGGTSRLARLTRSLETGVPFKQITSATAKFVTNVFACDCNGLVRNINKPLHECIYATLEEARLGHAKTLELLANGKLKFMPPPAIE